MGTEVRHSRRRGVPTRGRVFDGGRLCGFRAVPVDYLDRLSSGSGGRITRRPSIGNAFSSMENPSPSLCGKAAPILLQLLGCVQDSEHYVHSGIAPSKKSGG